MNAAYDCGLSMSVEIQACGISPELESGVPAAVV